MTRIILISVLVMVLGVISYVVITVVPRQDHTRFDKPSVEDSNETWADYYYRMAESARGTGDETRANEYEIFARMYTGFEEKNTP